MKSLRPATREKKRYLLISGKSPAKNIEKTILEFIGINGLSKCGLSFIKSNTTSTIICINREMVDQVRASIAVFSEKMKVEKVSGTLKGLAKK